MKWLVAVLALCVLVPSVHCADSSIEWCYHEPACNAATWPTIVPKYCNGSRQSPINIVPASAKPDANLVAFTFNNFGSTTHLKKMENTGKTLKVSFENGVSISGGGLSEPYDSLQFHLHWGNGTAHPGSEHTVNGKRYAMEFHIVSIRQSFNRNVTLALANSTGAAALGFFIEESANASVSPAKWKTLTSYLHNITQKGESVAIAAGISLDDLLEGVDRTKYYRYLGSLTTPSCNEIVVWTVFKESIKVSKEVIDLFSTTLHVNTTSSPLMIDVYRSLQPELQVTTQPETSSSTSTTCYSLGLMALSLILGRN